MQRHFCDVGESYFYLSDSAVEVRRTKTGVVITAGTDCPTAPVDWHSQGDLDDCMGADPHHAIGIVEGWNALPKTPRIIPAAIKREIPQFDTAGVSLFVTLLATGAMSTLGVEDLTEDASPPADTPIYLASGLAETDPVTASIPLILYCVLPIAVIAWLVGMGFLPIPLGG